jgi:hypothetical protein
MMCNVKGLPVNPIRTFLAHVGRDGCLPVSGICPWFPCV